MLYTVCRPTLYTEYNWYVVGLQNNNVCNIMLYSFSVEQLSTTSIAYSRLDQQLSTTSIAYSEPHYSGWLRGSGGCQSSNWMVYPERHATKSRQVCARSRRYSFTAVKVWATGGRQHCWNVCALLWFHHVSRLHHRLVKVFLEQSWSYWSVFLMLICVKIYLYYIWHT